MTSLVAAERYFTIYRRGELREDILRNWRNGLRKLVNPETGLLFTEDEIAAATVRESRWWIEADFEDLQQQVSQQRALFLADQWRPRRASSGMLRGFHSELWKEAPLDAVGGSGDVQAPATPGTVFVGSTTIPDDTATVFVDPTNGLKYQVLFTETATADAFGAGLHGATLTLQGIDTGPDTNPPVNRELKYAANAPLGQTGPAKVSVPFKGGLAAETDADFGKRLEDRIATKPASGNAAHFRAWARQASVAIADAYVYPCAWHAGSVLVCVTAKRGNVQGPDGRIPSTATLTTATQYLTPPGSPVVPRPPHVLVVKPVKRTSNLVISLDMRKASSSGWTDRVPWPSQNAGVAGTITGVATQTEFTYTRAAGSAGLPAGVTAPSLMVWNAATSRYEKLIVSSVVFTAGNAFTVTLAQAPTTTLVTGMVVCPDSGRRVQIAEAVEAYFDSLGPGEVVNLATDDRAHRAFRFPEPFVEAPQRAGASVLTFIRDALQAAVANEILESVSVTTPTVPADPASGPELIVAGTVGVFAAA